MLDVDACLTSLKKPKDFQNNKQKAKIFSSHPCTQNEMSERQNGIPNYFCFFNLPFLAKHQKIGFFRHAKWSLNFSFCSTGQLQPYKQIPSSWNIGLLKDFSGSKFLFTGKTCFSALWIKLLCFFGVLRGTSNSCMALITKGAGVEVEFGG